MITIGEFSKPALHQNGAKRGLYTELSGDYAKMREWMESEGYQVSAAPIDLMKFL